MVLVVLTHAAVMWPSSPVDVGDSTRGCEVELPFETTSVEDPARPCPHAEMTSGQYHYDMAAFAPLAAA
jgi:hypothetical protein